MFDSGRVVFDSGWLHHRHGGEWHPMTETSPHDPATEDPERRWAGGRVFRCVSCEDEIMVRPPDDGR